MALMVVGLLNYKDDYWVNPRIDLPIFLSY